MFPARGPDRGKSGLRARKRSIAFRLLLSLNLSLDPYWYLTRAQAAFSAQAFRRILRAGFGQELTLRVSFPSSRFFCDTSRVCICGAAPMARRPRRNSASQTAAANRATATAPRCGARCRLDGKPCRKPAMKNGRCYLHGGKTPSGNQWHVVQYGDCSTPYGEAKFNRKILDHQRYAKKRAARLAGMTTEQRAKHDAWHRSHAPGAAARRSADRVRAAQNAEMRRLLAQEPRQRPEDLELSQIKAALAAVRAELEWSEASAGKSSNDEEGVFS